MAVYQMIKQPGGVLIPSDEMTADSLTCLKTGELYQVEIKRQRNPAFHRKMFSFFQFAFQYWRGANQFQDEQKQFDSFRNELTIMAGYYDQVFALDGSFRLIARSLSFASMDNDEFNQCAIAMQNAAMRTIFQGADERTIQQLYSYF